MQINHKTREAYSGSNADTLAHIQGSRAYKLNEWLTFLQAKELGFKVKKGEHGIRLMRVIDDKDEQGKDARYVRGFTVFNIEQTEPSRAMTQTDIDAYYDEKEFQREHARG